MNTQERLLPVLFGTLLIDMIGFGMVLPIIPIIFTDASSPSFLLRGYSPSVHLFMAGAITALWGLMQFITAPILGELSDVHGRKRLLMFGVGTLAVAQLLFAFGVERGLIAVLFVARGLAGIAAGNVGIAQAAIADVTEPSDRAKNFGLIGSALGMGVIFGPLLSGWLAGLFHNPAFPFFVAGILGILNVFLVMLFLEETNTRPKKDYAFTATKGLRNIRSAIGDPETRQIYATSFLYLLGFTMFTSFFGIFLTDVFSFSEAQTGTAFSATGVCAVVAQLVILRILSKKYTERIMLRYALPLVGVSVGLSAFMPNPVLFLACIPFIAVPHGLTVANIPTLLSKSVSAERQGAALGINASLVALASGLAPIVMGIVAGVFGVRAPFVTGALVVLFAWCILYFFKGQLGRSKPLTDVPAGDGR